MADAGRAIRGVLMPKAWRIVMLWLGIAVLFIVASL